MMARPKTVSRHDAKIAILKVMADGRERLASEIYDRVDPKLGLSHHQVCRHLGEMARLDIVKTEILPENLKAYRVTTTGKCPGCGRDVSFLIPGTVYRCPTCSS
jgi:hypothetical protein